MGVTKSQTRLSDEARMHCQSKQVTFGEIRDKGKGFASLLYLPALPITFPPIKWAHQGLPSLLGGRSQGSNDTVHTKSLCKLKFWVGLEAQCPPHGDRSWVSTVASSCFILMPLCTDWNCPFPPALSSPGLGFNVISSLSPHPAQAALFITHYFLHRLYPKL